MKQRAAVVHLKQCLSINVLLLLKSVVVQTEESRCDGSPKGSRTMLTLVRPIYDSLDRTN